MSFGFSIGDFIQCIQVAHKLVAKCKASTVEFRDLSRDVTSMQIVLDAVHDYWQTQAKRGRDLSESQKENLQELTENCCNVLDETDALLQKHGGLEAGTGFLNRIKWLRAGDLGPLRMRLLMRTMYLSQFNTTITAYAVDDPQLSSQARVLNALTVINYRYHTGKRSAPAFSQKTSEELDTDATWQEINDDLEKEGVDQIALAAEKPFIKKWVRDCILAEDCPQNEKEDQADDESVYSSRIQPMSDGEADGRSFLTEDTTPSRWSPKPMSRNQTDATLVNVSPTLSHELNQTSTRDSRASISSEKRRGPDQPRHNSIQASLVSLFRLEHGVSREQVHLKTWVEHLYAQLDTRKRGIFRGQFEGPIMQAIDIVKPVARDAILEIILSDTSRPGSRLDQTAFVDMLFKILEYLDNSEKNTGDTKSNDLPDGTMESIRLGESIAYTWLSSRLDAQTVEEILPFGWVSKIRKISSTPGVTEATNRARFSYIPHNVVCHATTSPTLPVQAMTTFAGMSLLIGQCVGELYYVLELWETHSELDDQYLRGYLDLIDDVIDAAHKFDVFDPRQSPSPESNLDKMVGEAEIIDLTDTTIAGHIKAFPVQDLQNLQCNAYRSLQAILGFLFELTLDAFQVDVRDQCRVALNPRNGTRAGFGFPYHAEPPAPGIWRVKMEARASRILTDANCWWEGATEVITKCRSYASSHKLLSRRAAEALEGSRNLDKQAKSCQHLVLRRPTELITEKFIVLTLESLQDLPKGNKYFRAGPPDIVAKILIDNDELASKAAVRTELPSSKQISVWNVETPCHISTSPGSIIFIHIHNMKRRVDRIDQGFMGLVKLDVSQLPTAIDCKAKTIPLLNSYKPGTPAGNLTLRAHWCPLVDFARRNQSSLAPHWARRDTSDDRFFFEDLKADERAPGSRTAIFESRQAALVSKLVPLTIVGGQGATKGRSDSMMS